MAKKEIEQTEIEAPYELPEGWKWEKWGNVGRFIAGNGFKEKFQGFTNYNIPFYKVGSLKFSDSTGFLFDKTNTINDEILQELKATLIPENSIIFAKIGEAIRLNRRSINSVKCCIDNNLMAFLSENCNYKYVFFWSKSIDLYKYTNATTVPAIRKSDLEEIPFPLPPTLAEQQRIVNRIESMFVKLDEAKEKAQNVVDGFETRKAAILHKAFTGELTANWRRENGVSDDSWVVKRLEECTSAIGDGLHGTPKFNSEGQYFFINGGNLSSEDINFTSDTKKVDEAEYNKYKVLLNDTTVFLSINGSTLGKRTAFYKNEPVILGKSACYINVSEILNKYFLRYYFNSPYFQKYTKEKQTGSAIPNLGLKAIRDFSINLPTLPEQVEIVRILDIIIEKENKAKQAAETVLEQIDLLKKSILARAFRGEL